MNKIMRKAIQILLGPEKFEKCRYLKRKIKYSKKNSSNYCPCCRSFVKEWYSFRERQWNDSYNTELFDDELDKCACPICDSIPRHRIESVWLDEQSISGKNVLLWAPENSMKTYLNTKSTNLVTADLYDNKVMKIEDIECSSFSENEFDYIICNHVLEHVKDVENALKDTYRILKDDGTVLITVPLMPGLKKTYEDKNINSESDRRKNYGQGDHLRLFGEDICDYLIRTNFEVIKYVGDIECNHKILPIIAPSKYDCNILYICKKRFC